LKQLRQPMTDIYDQATDKEMRDRELAIKAARSQNKAIEFTGRCLSCEEHIDKGRFCDAACREDFELAEKMKRLQGRK
jgi:hypothetical protein